MAMLHGKYDHDDGDDNDETVGPQRWVGCVEQGPLGHFVQPPDWENDA